MFTSIRAELRSALRRIVRGPSASIVSIAALACGIGAAAATWSLMNALLINPLPVAAPESLFVVGIETLGDGRDRVDDSYSYTMYPPARDSNAFDRLVGSGIVRVPASDSEIVEVQFASHDYFDTLGVPIVLGRSFVTADDVRGARPAVILTHAYWQSRFAGDRNILGTAISVGEADGVIVGVAARGFRGTNLARSPQVFLPLHTVDQTWVESPSNYFAEPIPPARSSPSSWLTFIGRLDPGSSVAAARDRFKNFVLEAYPTASTADFDIVLTPINESAVPAAARDGMRQFVLLLAGTVGLLLLAGSLSAAMLLLVRTESRRDELATARALGASGGRIAAGIATEGGVIALAGALAAIPVAHWLFTGMSTFDLPGNVPIAALGLAVDGSLLAALGIGALIAMATATLIAAAFAATVSRTGVLGARAHATAGPSHRGARSWLVVGQVAAALVLLAGTGLFARSLIAALTLNPGYETDRIVSGTVPFPADRAEQLFDELIQRLDANATIESAATMQYAGAMSTFGQLDVDGIPQQFPSTVQYRVIDDRYLPTMGLPIVDGRGFTADDRDGNEAVAIVSESMARQIRTADNEAIGRRIGLGIGDNEVLVVGVVPDIVLNVTELEPLVLYMPTAQSIFPGPRSLVFRAASENPAVAMREVVTTVRELAPDVIPGPLQTIDAQLVAQLREQRFGITLMGALSAIAVLLTAMAIYVLAESMGLRRRREFGIRAALGAHGSSLAGRILGETVRLVGIGVVVGLVVTWAGARMIQTFLFQVHPLDGVTLVSVAALMLILALLVSLKPAISAMRVDLSRLLRDE